MKLNDTVEVLIYLIKSKLSNYRLLLKLKKKDR